MADKMAEIIKKASEAAQLVPENLQAAAFEKVFDALMAADSEVVSSHATSKKKTKKKTARKSTQSEILADGGPSLDELNRTEHPKINHYGSGLNNSLRLLQAARQDLDIDGLSATQIAKVLTDKFRSGISAQGVSKVLNAAGKFVDRRKIGKEVIFRIMAPGEEYLETIEDSAEATPKKKAKRKAGKKTKKKAAKKKSTKKKGAKKKPAKKATRSSNKKSGTKRVGALAALTEVFEDDFFGSARTVADLIENLQLNYGRTFKSREMSAVLLRYLRSKKLSRSKNADGQYEYINK